MKNDRFFQGMIREALPDVVVTNYIVVAECVSESGTDLQVILSDSVTPWLAGGMLEFASDMLYSGQNSFHTIEDEGE